MAPCQHKQPPRCHGAEGEVDFNFETMEGLDKSFVFQIAEVNKALASISYLVDRDYKVTFNKDMKTGRDMSYMLHKPTQTVARFRRERNVWVLDALVDAEAEDEKNKEPGFHRHA